jgi:hypothetical protein
MRQSTFFALAAALSAVGCATSSAKNPDKIQTTEQANRESVEGAAEAPLRDLNVLRTKIPDILLQAMNDPYKRPSMGLRLTRKAQCAELAELIKPLDQALGADLDEPSKDEDDVVVKGRETAYGAAATLASSTIPFHGWVRKLSGAERHDHLVQAAIVGGAVRRAYLKGLGESRGCDPPATPSHLLTPAQDQPGAPGTPGPSVQPTAASETGRMKPRYPIR